MSEYQYYEFQAIDRPLTPEEQQAVSRLSSRVRPHPTQAVFTYHYGSFPGSSEEVLAQYYDALFYIANWGSVRLAFRFPKKLLDVKAIAPYCIEEHVRITDVGDYMLLIFERIDEQPRWDWIESEGLLIGLTPLREAIIAGDYRVLYLVWLLAVAMDWLDDEAVEPPLPAGLGQLNGALKSFADLFDVDPHLLAAAAEESGDMGQTNLADLTQVIATLPTEEQQAWLLRLAQGEPNLAQQFKRRLPLKKSGRPGLHASRRTVRDIIQRAEELWQAEEARLQAEAAAKHTQEMEALALKAEDTWRRVQQLIGQKNARSYDEAVTQLLRLKQLAAYQGRSAEFLARVAHLSDEYARRPSLVERLRQAGLL